MDLLCLQCCSHSADQHIGTLITYNGHLCTMFRLSFTAVFGVFDALGFIQFSNWVERGMSRSIDFSKVTEKIHYLVKIRHPRHSYF